MEQILDQLQVGTVVYISSRDPSKSSIVGQFLGRDQYDPETGASARLHIGGTRMGLRSAQLSGHQTFWYPNNLCKGEGYMVPLIQNILDGETQLVVGADKVRRAMDINNAAGYKEFEVLLNRD